MKGGGAYGNLVGTDGNGTRAFANNGDGIRVMDSYGVQIGGPGLYGQNVISGNARHGIFFDGGENHIIQSNRIGVDINGLHAIANGAHGIYMEGAQTVTIGGLRDTEGNVLSGNTESGIYAYDAWNPVIQGNYIGTNTAGNAPLPNGTVGVRLNNLDDAFIGHLSSPAHGNVISCNQMDGILFMSDGSPQRNYIYNNFIGTDVSGTLNLGNER